MDLIQFYKVQNEIDHVEWKNKLLKTIQGKNGSVTSTLRKQGSNLLGENAKTISLRVYFFLNKVIPPGNELSIEVIEASTLKNYKARLDKVKLFII